jgi:hypothetical protein
VVSLSKIKLTPNFTAIVTAHGKTEEDINLEIRKRKFRWIDHTLRKEDGEIPKAALLWNPQRNRKRGRLRNSWGRSVMKEAGRSWNDLRFLAADRSGKDS